MESKLPKAPAFSWKDLIEPTPTSRAAFTLRKGRNTKDESWKKSALATTRFWGQNKAAEAPSNLATIGDKPPKSFPEQSTTALTFKDKYMEDKTKLKNNVKSRLKHMASPETIPNSLTISASKEVIKAFKTGYTDTSINTSTMKPSILMAHN
jgi:hypothetical protein